MYPFIIALVQYVSAVTVCNQDLSYSSSLISPCKGNDVAVLWPNYKDPSTFYKCIAVGKTELQYCPPGTYFTYYFQQCTNCKHFIASPECEYLQQTTDVTCINNGIPTPSYTTKAPTTKAPVTTLTKETTTKAPLTTKIPVTTKTPPPIPTPPSQGSKTTTGIPMPPMVVTPVPGIPTPPNENATPPSIPGTPPMLTTLASA